MNKTYWILKRIDLKGTPISNVYTPEPQHNEHNYRRNQAS